MDRITPPHIKTGQIQPPIKTKVKILIAFQATVNAFQSRRAEEVNCVMIQTYIFPLTEYLPAQV